MDTIPAVRAALKELYVFKSIYNFDVDFITLTHDQAQSVEFKFRPKFVESVNFSIIISISALKSSYSIKN